MKGEGCAHLKADRVDRHTAEEGRLDEVEDALVLLRVDHVRGGLEVVVGPSTSRARAKAASM